TITNAGQSAWTVLAPEQGRQALPYSSLDARSLGAAIRDLILSCRAPNQTAPLRQEIHNESGTRKAATLIEKLVRSAGLALDPNCEAGWAAGCAQDRTGSRKARLQNLRNRRRGFST